MQALVPTVGPALRVQGGGSWSYVFRLWAGLWASGLAGLPGVVQVQGSLGAGLTV